MESRRIVVGVDGSEGSRRALRWAIAEAAKQDAVIEAVTVWQSPFGFGDTMGAHLDEGKIERAARDNLQKTIAEVAGDGPSAMIEPIVVEGDPAQVLCHQSAGADLLVMGSLGHSPFTSPALGSVSLRCAQHSACPVVIVPKDNPPPSGTG
ncbi:MAG: universal stress protein [Actinomycetota bacterium]|nr:universal stress protein [Actinomycetota bacterium]